MAPDDVCTNAVDSLLPSSLIGFLTELALGRYVDLPQPEERDILKEAFDLFKAPKSIPTVAKRTNKKTAKTTAKKPAKRKPKAKAGRTTGFLPSLGAPRTFTSNNGVPQDL